MSQRRPALLVALAFALAACFLLPRGAALESGAAIRDGAEASRRLISRRAEPHPKHSMTIDVGLKSKSDWSPTGEGVGEQEKCGECSHKKCSRQVRVVVRAWV